MIFERGQFLLQLCEDYSQFFHTCNWYDFHFAQIVVENDKAMGAFEVVFIVLGLGFRLRWNHTETEMKQQILEQSRVIAKNFDVEEFF